MSGLKTAWSLHVSSYRPICICQLVGDMLYQDERPSSSCELTDVPLQNGYSRPLLYDNNKSCLPICIEL